MPWVVISLMALKGIFDWGGSLALLMSPIGSYAPTCTNIVQPNLSYAKLQFYLRNLHNRFSSWLFSDNHWLDVSLENTQRMWPLRTISRIISIKQQNTFKSEGLTQRYKSFVHYILNIGGHQLTWESSTTSKGWLHNVCSWAYQKRCQ